MSIPKLRLRGVSKQFTAARAATPTLAVADFALDVQAGEFVCIVGPSGCGKSTVLNLIAGLDTPSSGTIEMDGRAIKGPGADRGVMFQDYALMPWQTVEQNVGFGLAHGTPGQGMTKAQREARVREHVALVGLTGAQTKYPHQLSGGMRQRVALARLLANGPDILLLDEPLGALDAQTRLILQVELLRIWGDTKAEPAARPPEGGLAPPRGDGAQRLAGSISQRKTAIFITHDIEEAVFLGDRVIVMSSHPGRVKADIAIDLPRPRHEHIRTDRRFGELSEQIWSLIRDEAYRAIGGGTVAPPLSPITEETTT